MLDAIFKIKLAHVKAVFQSVHGFLNAKLVLKDNIKLFCVEFASQVSLEVVFLVELTSSIHLTTLKIAKSLVVSESGSLFAAVVLCNMPLGVSATDIKTVLSVFGMITHVVLKPAGIWQYVVVHFKNLVAATFALNYWSVLVDKDNVQILFFVNQQETIVFCNKFKTKLVNLSPGCIVFEISDMVSQVGGWSCFISQSLDSGHCFCFALVTFGFQADLDFAVISHLAINYKIAPPFSFKASKMFKPHFVGSLSYAKTSVSSVFSMFPPLVAAALLVVVIDSLVFFWLTSLESDLAKLSVLVKSIVKSVGSMVKVFEQFVNGNLVSSSAFGLRVNKVLVHISIFSRAVSKLKQDVVILKTGCGFENINMSGSYADVFKTAE
ncbi:hypothetical protein G9A89_013769 [Geosiphon pyriformis]|nr:hypothetical protein G9A89_013769 [Geosiphon pyriformis]